MIRIAITEAAFVAAADTGYYGPYYGAYVYPRYRHCWVTAYGGRRCYRR